MTLSLTAEILVDDQGGYKGAVHREGICVVFCLFGVFHGDGRKTAPGRDAAHNCAILHHIVLNLIRMAPVKRKGGLEVRRFIATPPRSFPYSTPRPSIRFMLSLWTPSNIGKIPEEIVSFGWAD